ncbi:unnamed protein product, partial [Polarella glacialis]
AEAISSLHALDADVCSDCGREKEDLFLLQSTISRIRGGGSLSASANVTEPIKSEAAVSEPNFLEAAFEAAEADAPKREAAKSTQGPLSSKFLQDVMAAASSGSKSKPAVAFGQREARLAARARSSR